MRELEDDPYYKAWLALGPSFDKKILEDAKARRLREEQREKLYLALLKKFEIDEVFKMKQEYKLSYDVIATNLLYNIRVEKYSKYKNGTAVYREGIVFEDDGTIKAEFERAIAAYAAITSDLVEKVSVLANIKED